MDNQNPKQQLVEKLKAASNILVTVSSNPSVDQLAACIGLTIWLNKLDKHASAVFSGDVPSTLEFLQPEDTLEKNTDSLRDFIIALDKSKADKLRYKVEDKVVKIFITPYKTSISQADLEFSQGDFNIDVVVCLGVREQQDLDEAITAHGRILHDATVASLNTGTEGGLGSINWQDPAASSLSEMVVELGNDLDRTLVDSQIATALLTGIVAETARFSNEKTSPQTMSVSAELMSAGANQQLVANKLEENAPVTVTTPSEPAAEPAAPADQDQPEPENPSAPDEAANDDGSLNIEHADNEVDQGAEEAKPTEDNVDSGPPDNPVPSDTNDDADSGAEPDSRTPVTEPPQMGGTLTANTQPEGYDPSTDPLSLPKVEAPEPLMDHQPPAPFSPSAADAVATPPPLPVWTPPSMPSNDNVSALPSDNPSADVPATDQPADTDNPTLTDLEQSVGSPHVDPDHLAAARDEVSKALTSGPVDNPEPIAALNAQPFDVDLSHSDATSLPPAGGPASPSGPSLPPPPTDNQILIDASGNLQTNDAASPTNLGPLPAVSHEEAPGQISPANQPLDMPLPPNLMPPVPSTVPPTDSATPGPGAPPPVPPPMMPLPFVNPNEPPRQ